MKEQAKVEQKEKNTFYFSVDNPKNEPIKVYIKDSLDNDKKQLLLETKDNQFSIYLPQLISRPYFVIEKSDKSFVLGERTLPVEGMNNFRDMGGYETEDGRHVKWGMLYRSDHLYNATRAGIEYIKKLDIHTIIDYRSEEEVQKYPNPWINADIVSYVLDPAAHAAELSAQFTSSRENEDQALINKIIEEKSEQKGSTIDEQYVTFVDKKESIEAFAQMINIVANPKSPAVIQHCRGGKDRTGFGAMLLLGILGVKEEELVFDYMLTAKNRETRNKIKMEGYKKLTDDPAILAYLYSLIDTKPEFITTSIRAIKDQYETIQNYAVNKMEISEKTIVQLKELYLE